MQTIPLRSIARQSMTLTLADRPMLVEAWWQPSDRAWYLSVSSPPNSPVITGRRITLGTSLLPAHAGIGNMWCIELTGANIEPDFDAWDGDHRLIYDVELAS